MGQIIGITKVKNPYKFMRLLKKDYPNIPNNKFDELIFNINNNNFVWYIRCKENEIRSISEYCNLFIRSSKYMKQNQFEFKPFEHVLVRYDGQSEWTTGIYSRIGKNVMNETVHVCAGGGLPYKECIPYNEETAHLLGTTKAYQPPQPKTYHVEWGLDSQMEQQDYTDKEFENFIKTAVLHNKDIQNFNVRKI